MALKEFYTIGEVAKIYQVSIRTLRYYEEKDILLPHHVDETNGYRFYSNKQFFVLDMIGCFRKMGLTVDEIREQFEAKDAAGGLMAMLDRQKAIYEEKIHEAQRMKSYVGRIYNDISWLEGLPKKQIVLHERESYKVISFFADIDGEDEREAYFREVLTYIEANYGETYPLLSCIVPITKAEVGNYIYTHIEYHEREGTKVGKQRSQSEEIPFLCKSKKIRIEESTVEAGKYLSICYNTTWNEMANNYQALLNYVELEKIDTLGFFRDVWVMPRINDVGEISILGNLELPMK